MARDDERAGMVDRLQKHGYVRTQRVRDAMLKVERHLFVHAEMERDAYRDSPLPIGNGQTISAPHMVAMMAELVGPSGTVVTMERLPALARECRENLTRAGYEGVVVIEGDGALGSPEMAPYDCILVACAAKRMPEALVSQLAEGGRLAIPIGGGMYQELVLATKMDGRLLKEKHGGVAFVPMVSDKV